MHDCRLEWLWQSGGHRDTHRCADNGAHGNPTAGDPHCNRSAHVARCNRYTRSTGANNYSDSAHCAFRTRASDRTDRARYAYSTRANSCPYCAR